MSDKHQFNSWPDEANRAFGARIREARDAKGYTQQMVADRVSVRKGSVSAWENGTRTLKHHDLAMLCQVLGVSADELLFGLKRWPFEGVKFESVAQLEPNEIAKLEGAMVSTASQYGYPLELVRSDAKQAALKQANGGNS
jgi:transcriptional regulator with XRE-family HTH domain